MRFQRYTTAEGFPGVAWEQEVPTGETEYSRTQELRWRLAILIGLVVFGAMLGAGSDLGTSLGVGVAAAFVVAAADGLRSMKFNIQGTTVGGFEKTEHEREAERRWKVTRLYRSERRCAEVHYVPKSKTLAFVLLAGEAGKAEVIDAVPLLSFAELELSTDQEWFGDIGGRELAQQQQVGSAWVIVEQPEGGGVLLIARSGRDKASMARLHQILRSEFIAAGRRREMQAKAEELASRRGGEAGAA
jgi:hypothetical protein